MRGWRRWLLRKVKCAQWNAKTGASQPSGDVAALPSQTKSMAGVRGFCRASRYKPSSTDPATLMPKHPGQNGDSPFRINVDPECSCRFAIEGGRRAFAFRAHLTNRYLARWPLTNKVSPCTSTESLAIGAGRSLLSGKRLGGFRGNLPMTGGPGGTAYQCTAQRQHARRSAESVMPDGASVQRRQGNLLRGRSIRANREVDKILGAWPSRKLGVFPQP